MSDTEAGSLAEWLMSGEPPKTYEQRVWWHEYKTHDGIKEHAERIASLEELVLDMYGFIERMDEECGDVTFSDCFDYCKHDTTDDGCCKTGECWYEQRMRELGLEDE